MSSPCISDPSSSALTEGVAEQANTAEELTMSTTIIWDKYEK